MNFVKIFRILRASLPFIKSIFKAYKETTGGKPGDNSFFSQYFSKVMNQNNIGVSQMSITNALEVLNINKPIDQIDARYVLERYYFLFKKNDPKNGGTTYLQSKVYVAKQTIMAKFPNAAEAEQLFYNEVVQPEEKAEEQAKKKAEQNAKPKQEEKNDGKKE